MGSMWSSVAIVAIVAWTFVAIFGGRSGSKRDKHLKDDVTRLEGELEDALDRIEVLEKIVTDGKHTLRREIDDLAS